MSSFSNAESTNATDEKIKENQEQVKEITNIMQLNIEKALQRDVNLSNLDTNISNLQINAEDFKKAAKKTKKRFQWKNRKWTIVLIIVVLVVLALIALGIWLAFSK